MRIDYFIRFYTCENPVFKTSIFRNLGQILKLPTRRLKKTLALSQFFSSGAQDSITNGTEDLEQGAIFSHLLLTCRQFHAFSLVENTKGIQTR